MNSGSTDIDELFSSVAPNLLFIIFILILGLALIKPAAIH
jgi:hypothetical protein